MPGSLSVLLSLLGQTFGSGDVVLPSDVGGYDDNVIRLKDQNLPVRGTSVAEQVSEFETGIKIGPATYDNREHAFFMVMNDFSAGLGTHYIDVREELGGFWTPEQSNAADTSRSKYLVLPPKQTDYTDTGPTLNQYAATLRVGSAARRWIMDRENSSFFACGSAIYVSHDGGVTFTKDHEFGTEGIVLSFSKSYENIFGEATLQANGTMANIYIRGEVWGTGVLYPEGVWTANTRTAAVTDSMWWDGKLLIMDRVGLAFGVWERDADTLDIDITWNVQNPLDGEWIFLKLHPNYEGVFVGTAMAPWGQPSVYFHDETQLYVVDFFARKYYPIELGLGRRFTGNTMFGGNILLLDGKNAWEYAPGGNTVRNIGLPDKQGPVPSLRSTNQDWLLRHPFQVDDELYCVAVTIADSGGTPRSMLMKYNGKGWHQIGKPMEYLAHGAAYIPVSPDPSGPRNIVVWGTDLNQTSTVMKHTVFELPNYSSTPFPTRDSFGDSGAAFITGWMNGGFNDIDGTLLRMKIDAQYLTTTETVKVEFQLDGDESSTWRQLVDKNNIPEVFDEDHTTLYFSTDPDGDLASYQPRKGVLFNSVRFRITLTRGSDETLSPVVKALILMYIKVPDFRLALTFTVDVNRMLEENTDTVYYVDGAEATLRNVHQKLISLWNEHVLHQLIVPNVVTVEDNVYVRIVGMPLRFQEFKDSVAGRGVIELSLIEPLERVT